MSKKVLVIGNGSREHCIAWKLSQSSKVSNIIVSPGNGGLSQCGGKISMIGMYLFKFDMKKINSMKIINGQI